MMSIIHKLSRINSCYIPNSVLIDKLSTTGLKKFNLMDNAEFSEFIK